jgi:hypothetical protein
MFVSKAASFLIPNISSIFSLADLIAFEVLLLKAFATN